MIRRDGYLWVRAGAELSLDDELEVSLEAGRPLTREETALCNRVRACEDARRKALRQVYDDSQLPAAEAIEAIEEAYTSVVELLIETEAQLDVVLGRVEAAINCLTPLAPKGYRLGFYRGYWLSDGWAEACIGGPILHEREVSLGVKQRRAALEQQRADRIMQRVNALTPLDEGPSQC
jgi:hypothetical protein